MAKLDFQAIFGVPTLEDTIRVLIRLYRAKRLHNLGAAERLWPRVHELKPWEDILPGRRFHHLTPTRRGNLPYRGDTTANLLLIKNGRHLALHKFFDALTLEEIIIVLLKVHVMGRRLYGRLQHWYEQSCALRKRRQRNRQKNFLSQFQSNLLKWSPRILGLPLFLRVLYYVSEIA